MNILYQSDNNYAAMLGVSLTSLLENNKDVDSINVYIIDGGISAENSGKLIHTVEKYGRKLTFIQIDNLNKKLESIGAKKLRNSYMTYYKLFVREFLPKGIDKILYVDCDTIVSKIGGIFDLDIGNNAVAMVQDLFLYDYKKNHGFKPDDKYFNAGVILFNYQAWDSMNYGAILENYIEHADMSSLKMHEQDVLNYAFKGHIKEMPLRYNCYGPLKLSSVNDFYEVYNRNLLFTKENMIDEVDNACVFHFLRFIGKGPNNINNIHPYNKLYHDYKDISEWKDDSDVKVPTSFMLRVENCLYHILPRKVFIYIFKKVHDIRKEV